MKKIILLALAALLIFTMVSCDGNADFLLWNEEEGTEKNITLIISGGSWWFFDSVDNISVEITVNADKWGDLSDEALGHNLYDYDYDDTYENAKFSSKYNFMTVSADNLNNPTLYISTSNESSSDQWFVKTTDEIVDGKTYYVYVYYNS